MLWFLMSSLKLMWKFKCHCNRIKNHSVLLWMNSYHYCQDKLAVLRAGLYESKLTFSCACSSPIPPISWPNKKVLSFVVFPICNLEETVQSLYISMQCSPEPSDVAIEGINSLSEKVAKWDFPFWPAFLCTFCYITRPLPEAGAFSLRFPSFSNVGSNSILYIYNVSCTLLQKKTKTPGFTRLFPVLLYLLLEPFNQFV